GYDDHLMEPFVSRDGQYLFFNNLNQPSVNTNLHWATRINDTLFHYEGELAGVNTPSLEGVPTMDRNNHFYYIYTGSYEQTLSTIYEGIFDSGQVMQPALVEGISRRQVGWLNFDVEVSDDGESLYFVDGRFDASGGPHEADLVIAQMQNGQFSRLDDSEEILRNVNTEALEYAAAISPDELELYFTRVKAPLNANSMPQIYVATRLDITQPFSSAQMIPEISGFVEAPTVAPGNTGIYYHKKEQDRHRLYYLSRKK
ncbi:MAG: hypothetical protein KDD15_19355, partial [Lewinella sp.]|nr:hypothetical protein [Lewinella sp.]